MNLDDLKSEWQKSDLPTPHFDEFAAEVKVRTRKFESQLFWRDMREIAAAIFVVFAFSGWFLQMTNWISRIGAAVVILGAIEIAIVLQWARRKGRIEDADVPLRDYCHAELGRVDRQIRLLENLAWWYIAPLLFGCFLILEGHPTARFYRKLGLYGFMLAVAWFGIWLNRRATRVYLRPLRESIAGLLKEWDRNDSDSD